MAAELAPPTAGRPCYLLHHHNNLPYLGDGGLLGHSILWPLVSGCVQRLVECEWIDAPVYFPSPNRGPELTTLTQISQHALNSVLALFEILIPRTDPPPLVHLLFLLVILALYLALAYITVAAQGFYTYSFLDPGRGKGRVVGYALGILVAICVIYGVVWGLIWTRRRVTETAWGMSGKLSPKARREDEDMELAEEMK